MFLFKVSIFTIILSGTTASFIKYAGYEPVTGVADHAAIAEDQKLMEQYLGTMDGFQNAQSIYEKGGNSKSYAEISLDRALGTTVAKGTTISGLGGDGRTITGTAVDTYSADDSVIGFLYPTSDSIDSHVMCRVGGLPAADQETSGCLASKGTINIAGITEAFTYGEGEIVNKNGRTLKGFSTGANIRMRPGDDEQKPFFDFFTAYVKYYGVTDFADKIVVAAFANSKTPNFDNGNIDVTSYGFAARAEIIKKSTAYINTGLYAQRELYDALFDCEEDCDSGECNDAAVNALDEAVAFYVGNQQSGDPLGQGNLFYALAEKRCTGSATCVDEITGQSVVNKGIMKEFEVLKVKLGNGECESATLNVKEIVRLMYVPLIQGTLRYAYRTSSFASPTETMQAEGAIFAAGILPRVHACNPSAADTIYKNMMLKNGGAKADFAQVKQAFESVYPCMQVSCAEVGGIVDEVSGTDYVAGGEPCGKIDNLKATRSSASLFSLSVVVGFVGCITAFFM